MSSNKTTIQLKADIVIDACNLYIDSIKVQREKIKQRWITKQMTRRWFPAKTAEDAVARAHDPEWNHHGGYWLYAAETAKKMAEASKKHGSGTVDINDHMFEAISDYLEA